MKKDDRVYAIYSRKSKYTGKGESIGNQIEMCKEYLQSHYPDVTEENVVIFEDEGFSGKNMSRPALQNLMKEIDRKKIKAIIVYRLDRISRNTADFTNLIEKLKNLNTDFISIKEQFDTSNPMGRAMMYIASVFSQLERETTAERIRDNMHELAKTGRWLGGTTPTGYTSESVENISINGKKKKCCKLKTIPEEEAIVKMIFSLYLQYDSQTKTESELMRLGIKTKFDNYYTRFAIRAILQNPVYVIADKDSHKYFVEQEANLYSNETDFDGIRGIMAYNRTDQHGKSTVYKPIEEWIVSVGEHKGFISGKDWVKVQKSLERNKEKSYRKPRTSEALLGGLVHCTCGSKMYPRLSNRNTPDGDLIYMYNCNVKERSNGTVCNMKSINGNLLDKAVIKEVKSLAREKSVFLERMYELKHYYMNNADDHVEQMDYLKKEKKELEKKVEVIVNTLIVNQEGFAKEQLLKQLDATGKKINDIERRLTEMSEIAHKEQSDSLGFELLTEMMSSFANCVDEMTIEEKRSAVQLLIKKIVWDGEYIHVYFFGVSPDDEIIFPDVPMMPVGEKEQMGNYEISKFAICVDRE